MRKQEQLLWDAMREKVGKFVHLERIENMVDSGRPDVDALCRGKHAAVELKAAEEFPARPDTPVLGKKDGLNRNQKNWHLEWRRWGGQSWILVGVGRAASRRIFMVPGDKHDQVNFFTKTELEQHETNWDGVKVALGWRSA